jgi:hypothetical protein
LTAEENPSENLAKARFQGLPAKPGRADILRSARRWTDSALKGVAVVGLLVGSVRQGIAHGRYLWAAHGESENKLFLSSRPNVQLSSRVHPKFAKN